MSAEDVGCMVIVIGAILVMISYWRGWKDCERIEHIEIDSLRRELKSEVREREYAEWAGKEIAECVLRTRERAKCSDAGAAGIGAEVAGWSTSTGSGTCGSPQCFSYVTLKTETVKQSSSGASDRAPEQRPGAKSPASTAKKRGRGSSTAASRNARSRSKR